MFTINKKTQEFNHQELLKISAFLFLIIFLTYGETIRYDFVWDDQFFIDYDFRIRNLNITQFFTSYFFRGQYYRPLILSSFALNWKLAGADPVWFHFTNILFHWGTTVLVFILLRRLLRSGTAAVIGATIFGVHPVHTENISLICARGDLLAGFFFLGGFLSYIKYKHKESSRAYLWYIMTLICYAGALFSKEMALTLPAILFIYNRIYKTQISIARDYIPLIITTALYFALRYYAIGTVKGISSGNLNQVLLIPQIALTYFRLFIFPLSLRTIYSFDIPSAGIFDLKFIGQLALVIGNISFCFYLGKNRHLLMFGFLFMGISLLPVLNFIPLRPPFAERFAYLPSIGFALIMGYSYKILQERLSNQRIAWAASFVFLLIIGVLSFLSSQRNPVWKNNVSLWKSVLKQHPDLLSVKMNLALSYFDAREYERAVTIYSQVLKQDSTDVIVLKNLGKSFLTLGDTIKAVNYFRKAIHNSPSEMELYLKLSSILNKQNKTDDAITFLQSARNQIKSAELQLELGNNYLRKEKIDSAIILWKEAIVIDSIYEPAYRNLASAAFYLKDYQTAENYWRKIITFDSTTADIYLYWALMKKSIGKIDSALILARTGYRYSINTPLQNRFELLIKELDVLQ